MSKDIYVIIAHAAFAIAGGCINWLNNVSTNPRTLASFFIKLATSGFIGVMVYFLCKSVAIIPEGLTAALVGMSGYIGLPAIDIMVDIIMKRLGISSDILSKKDDIK